MEPIFLRLLAVVSEADVADCLGAARALLRWRDGPASLLFEVRDAAGAASVRSCCDEVQLDPGASMAAGCEFQRIVLADGATVSFYHSPMDPASHAPAALLFEAASLAISNIRQAAKQNLARAELLRRLGSLEGSCSQARRQIEELSGATSLLTRFFSWSAQATAIRHCSIDRIPPGGVALALLEIAMRLSAGLASALVLTPAASASTGEADELLLEVMAAKEGTTPSFLGVGGAARMVSEICGSRVPFASADAVQAVPGGGVYLSPQSGHPLFLRLSSPGALSPETLPISTLMADALGDPRRSLLCIPVLVRDGEPRPADFGADATDENFILIASSRLPLTITQRLLCTHASRTLQLALVTAKQRLVALDVAHRLQQVQLERETLAAEILQLRQQNVSAKMSLSYYVRGTEITATSVVASGPDPPDADSDPGPLVHLQHTVLVDAIKAMLSIEHRDSTKPFVTSSTGAAHVPSSTLHHTALATAGAAQPWASCNQDGTQNCTCTAEISSSIHAVLYPHLKSLRGSGTLQVALEVAEPEAPHVMARGAPEATEEAVFMAPMAHLRGGEAAYALRISWRSCAEECVRGHPMAFSNMECVLLKLVAEVVRLHLYNGAAIHAATASLRLAQNHDVSLSLQLQAARHNMQQAVREVHRLRQRDDALHAELMQANESLRLKQEQLSEKTAALQDVGKQLELCAQSTTIQRGYRLSMAQVLAAFATSSVFDLSGVAELQTGISGVMDDTQHVFVDEACASNGDRLLRSLCEDEIGGVRTLIGRFSYVALLNDARIVRGDPEPELTRERMILMEAFERKDHPPITSPSLVGESISNRSIGHPASVSGRFDAANRLQGRAVALEAVESISGCSGDLSAERLHSSFDWLQQWIVCPRATPTSSAVVLLSKFSLPPGSSSSSPAIPLVLVAVMRENGLETSPSFAGNTDCIDAAALTLGCTSVCLLLQRRERINLLQRIALGRRAADAASATMRSYLECDAIVAARDSFLRSS